MISGDFTVNSANCSGATVPGTTSDGTGTYSYCSVQVIFKPTQAGARTGTLTFNDSATGSPHTVALSGNGITANGSAVVSPTTTNFPATEVGQPSAYQYVYLNNPGNTPVNVTGLTFPTDFSQYNGYTPPFTMPAGSMNQYYVGVQFTPLTSGAKSETITFNTSAGNASATLVGTAIASSGVTLQATPHPYLSALW